MNLTFGVKSLTLTAILTCRGGETGRRRGLKILRSQEHVGSSPTPGTIFPCFSREIMRPVSKKENQRRAERLTQVLPVDCKVIKNASVNAPRHYLKKGDTFGGRTINISKDGLLINSDHELDIKTQIMVTMSLDNDHNQIKVLAEVAWVKRNAFDIYGRWAMGMKIQEIDEANFELLASFFSADPEA